MHSAQRRRQVIDALVMALIHDQMSALINDAIVAHLRSLRAVS